MKIYITAHSSINPLSELTDNHLPTQVIPSKEIRLSCKEPEYKSYIQDAGIRRRMSRVVKMGVAAAMQCLSLTDKQPDAIITATGLGCVSDTEKFLNNIIENDEQLLNPTPFIQSTFNTVGAQTAIGLKNTNYNMTYVHRNFSFESALLDAMIKIYDKEGDNILAGSYEETTDSSFAIMDRLGFWRGGVPCGEGAHFFMLSKNQLSNIIFKDVATISSNDSEIIRGKLTSFLQKNDITIEEIDTFISGKIGNNKAVPYYHSIENLFTDSNLITYKHFLGDYQTVSAAALWLAVKCISQNFIPSYLIEKNRNRTINKILIYNNFQGQNHSFIIVEKEK